MLPSSRALLLHTPPLKYHLISATKQTVSPMTAISVLAVLWEMKSSPFWDKIETKKQHNYSYIHLHSSPSMGILQIHNVKPAPSWLDSSVGRALHRYLRAHGFESRSGLNFFQALISKLLRLCVLLWWSIMSSKHNYVGVLV